MALICSLTNFNCRRDKVSNLELKSNRSETETSKWKSERNVTSHSNLKDQFSSLCEI